MKGNLYDTLMYCYNKRSLTVEKACNWLLYIGTKPDGISDARWSGMVKHLKREYQLD